MNQSEIKISLTLAEDYFKNKNYAFAEQILKKIIQADLNNSKANELLAYIYGNQGKLDDSFELLNIASEAVDCSPEALYYLGSFQLKRSLYSQAINSFQRCLKKVGNFFECLHDLGTAYACLGDSLKALTYYQQCLSFKKDSYELYFNIGRSLDELKRFDEAITHYDQAIALKPDYAEAHSNKGITLHELKRFDEAIAHYDQAIALKPDYAEVWSSKGITLHELKRFDEAIAHYDQAIALKPDYAEVWSSKGITLHELKRFDEAITHYDQAIALKPDYAEAHSNKGITLHELKRFDEAITHYDQAIALKPDYAEAYSNKGATLHELKRFDEAITHYDQAIALKPDYAEAHSNKGTILYELKRFDEAITHYDQAIALKPDYAEAYCNKGISLNELKRFDEAITHYDQAIALKPNYAEAWLNKSVIFEKLNKYDVAIEGYQKAIALKSDYYEVIEGLIEHIKMKMCDWTSLDEILPCLGKTEILCNKFFRSPLHLLAITDSPNLIKVLTEKYTNKFFPENKSLGKIHSNIEKEKISVAYFSADFNQHPVALLTAELFEMHDKNKFEIIGISLGVDDNSKVRNRIKSSCDKFIDARNISDKNIAQIARDLKVDIAIDLGGYTANNRPGIFSFRSAPVQINYIGFLGTMGSKYYDYIIADEYVVPDQLKESYSEKIIRLPFFQVNDNKRAASDKSITRDQLSIPKDAFVYCSFNSNYKIQPSIFNSWINILNSTNNSFLLLNSDNKWAEKNLKNILRSKKINLDRIIFCERLPEPDYLARYKVCDLFLDTFPYNAGTTASDCLRMGVPLLTLSGKTFPSRMGGSILKAIQLDELITNSFQEYESTAIKLAKNSLFFNQIKLRLNKNKDQSLLFDTPKFTLNFEKALSEAHKRGLNKLPPDHIDIL